MLKQYIKQAFQMLKENRLVSTISITGTAISVTMIMMVVLVLQVQVANYYPEEHRDRMLYVEDGTCVKSEESQNSGNMADEAVKECFYSLKIPEAVTAYVQAMEPVSTLDKRNYTAYTVKMVDLNFWKIFSFHFIKGGPFTEADFESGIRQVVVSEWMARELFGTVDVVGKEVKLNAGIGRICGVVENVSKAAATAYADVWYPYTAWPLLKTSQELENMTGNFSVVLLAKKSSDFDAIRKELQQQIARYNATKEKYSISFFENPITQWDKAMGSIGQIYVDWKDFWLETGGAMLFLLLVPVLNLLGVTQSSIRKRQAEIGVRKAFGATSGNIVRQVLYENGLMSLLGGMIGLVLSWSLFPLCKDFLLKASDTALRAEMLFRPEAFVLALLFCMLINLLSAGLPAWWISRKPICEALKNGEETNK